MGSRWSGPPLVETGESRKVRVIEIKIRPSNTKQSLRECPTLRMHANEPSDTSRLPFGQHHSEAPYHLFLALQISFKDIEFGTRKVFTAQCAIFSITRREGWLPGGDRSVRLSHLKQEKGSPWTYSRTMQSSSSSTYIWDSRPSHPPILRSSVEESPMDGCTCVLVKPSQSNSRTKHLYFVTGIYYTAMNSTRKLI